VQNNASTSSNSSITITAGSGGYAGLHFGDSDNGRIGQVAYNNTDNALLFTANNSERMRIGSAGKVSWSANGIGAVATQDRDFTMYTEGASNGLDIRSNDYRNILLGAGGSSGAAMDAGYIGIYKDGVNKIGLNANGNTLFNGGAVGINRTPAISNCKLEVGGADNVNLIAVEASGTTFGLGVVGGSGSSRGGKIFVNTSLWVTANVDGNTSYTPDGLYGGSATPTRIGCTGSGELLLGYKDHGSGLYSAAMALSYDAIDGLNNTAYVDGFLMRDTSSNATTHLVIETDGDIKNTNNSYGSLSDERIKSDIADASSQWDDIKALKIRKYKLATQPAPYKDKFQIGVIAQELEAAGMNGLIKESDPDTKHIEHDASLLGQKVKSVKYSVLHMKALKALQEAMTRIETLEAKVATLEG